MAIWRYIKGSKMDFRGAPEWATMRTYDSGNRYFVEGHSVGDKALCIDDRDEFVIESEPNTSMLVIIAQRERVTEPQWRYIKGSEADFEGAPEWATIVGRLNSWSGTDFLEGIHMGAKFTGGIGRPAFNMTNPDQWSIIAQRERVTSVNDDRLAHDTDRLKQPTVTTGTGDHPLSYLNDFPKVEEKYPNRDNVNHPPHYTQGGIECIDALRAATVGKSGIEAVCVANVIKYLWRYEVKGGLESIEKAQWYLNHLLEVKRGTKSD